MWMLPIRKVFLLGRGISDKSGPLIWRFLPWLDVPELPLECPVVILSEAKNLQSFSVGAYEKANSQRCFPAFVPKSRDYGEAGASLNSPQDESAVADMTE